MSEMIERVEKALMSSLHYDWLNDPAVVEKFDPQNIEATRKKLRAAATAAVEAMRELTPAMVSGYARRSRSSRLGSYSHLDDEARNAMDAFVDAALADGS